MVKHLGIVGAGTMGTGIAQLAALAGIDVALYDINGTVLRQALERIKTNFKTATDKGELRQEQTTEALSRVHPRTRLAELSHSDIVVEAAIEDLRMKKDLFKHLEADTKPTTILASTTSSISITAIASATRQPGKVIGLHFIDSPINSQLVEIIQGQETSPETVQRMVDFCTQLHKSSVVARDNPGFIVNRVVQPFCGEALRILGERIAEVDQIDRIMKVIGGFESGPFETMDADGLDVHLTTTQTLYERSSGEPRYKPHTIQRQMVEAGMLGEKTGRGFYTYVENKK
jgi:3-hydroxybutyryl-CoA dehydrogenase